VNAQDPAKKFFKRGDVALRQSEEYWEKRLVREAVKAKFDLPDADATSAGLATRAERAEADDEKHKLPRAEVVRRLRERSQPIILFGESDADANRRLRQMEIDAPDFKQV
jgi:pre-mRNA-splicing factor 18